MTHHLQATALEAYVTGELDLDSGIALESHVAECQACSARLMHAAQVEVSLAEVAERSALRSHRGRARRSSFAAGAAIAMAAAVVLFLAPRGHADPSVAAPSASVAFERPITVEADASTSTAQLDGVGDAALKLGRD